MKILCFHIVKYISCVFNCFLAGFFFFFRINRFFYVWHLKGFVVIVGCELSKRSRQKAGNDESDYYRMV